MKLKRIEQEIFEYKKHGLDLLLETTSRKVIESSYNSNYVYEFNIRITNMLNKKQCFFKFSTSINDYNNKVKTIKNLGFALYCFISDSNYYNDNKTIDSFASELCITSISEAVRCFNACKNTFLKVQKLEISQDSLYDILNDEDLQ